MIFVQFYLFLFYCAVLCCWLKFVCLVELATECYEHACGKFPNKMELMMGLFNCYVREYSFVKQQQVCCCLPLWVWFFILFNLC